MEIYFASIPGEIKVGISRNVSARLRQLAAEVDEPIELLGIIEGDLEREQSIHKALAPYRTKGEWYQDCPDTRATIQNCFNNFGVRSITLARKENPFGKVCKALWPHKTAEELAARVGCAVRTAAYEISGEREPSALSVAVIVVEITRRE